MVRIIVDGPRNAVVLFTAPATLVIANLLGSPSRVTIQRLWYDMGGIADGAISWVATANVLAWRCTGVYHHDFEDFAGITNNAMEMYGCLQS
ncbi:MAG: hypothetical protein DDT31_00520 [Syntrophomonadaceae bacterium]|nr:hypothetical protein [Bacillota bacterium]